MVNGKKIPKGIKTEKRDELVYFRIDLTHPAAAGILKECEIQHQKRWIGAELSIQKNVAGTQAIVKVSGGLVWDGHKPEWSNQKGGAIIDIIPFSEKARIESLFYTDPEWKWIDRDPFPKVNPPGSLSE